MEGEAEGRSTLALILAVGLLGMMGFSLQSVTVKAKNSGDLPAYITGIRVQIEGHRAESRVTA
ncbi:hypothetical protein AKJ37_03975 [candidate division MSBL1 archaeon SCGC-AAA259I09]|uniref:Uncharacterized protein n=1 Tax=candidate division MSBL1 archaeon SCGC-AAA259I09 TaxID=1698267 RepID=A0A133US35_9EURY|nr:hypothetical protein AKJ37_03975 [candidate division MSBL1 archaeon SCGC-AAA259I09]